MLGWEFLKQKLKYLILQMCVQLVFAPTKKKKGNEKRKCIFH